MQAKGDQRTYVERERVQELVRFEPKTVEGK
jgi:hypothetical protein